MIEFNSNLLKVILNAIIQILSVIVNSMKEV